VLREEGTFRPDAESHLKKTVILRSSNQRCAASARSISVDGGFDEQETALSDRNVTQFPLADQGCPERGVPVDAGLICLTRTPLCLETQRPSKLKGQ
jgi:hypothetical protein